MSFSCPKCQAPIEGVVSQQTLIDRLAEKSTAIKDLEAKLAVLPTLEATSKEAQNLRQELILARNGVNDPRQIKRILSAYKGDIDGVDAAPTLDAWLKADGADVLSAFKGTPVTAAPVAPVVTPPATPPVTTAPVVAPPAVLPTDTGTVTTPPPGTGKLTVAQAEAKRAALMAQRAKLPIGQRGEIDKQLNDLSSQVA